MSVIDALRTVDLFAALDDADLQALADSAETVTLEPGEALFQEGDSGDTAFVITGGAVEVLKRGPSGSEVLLAVRGEGEVIGEMALVESAARSATVRARSAATLLQLPKGEFDRRIEGSATAAKALFAALLRRWRETEARLRQSERMAQLGTLSAGVAHEINNPAAAVQRAARDLEDAVGAYAAAMRTVAAAGIPEELDTVLQRITRGEPPKRLDGIARSDAEAVFEEWLDGHGVSEAWSVASALVEAGVSVDDLDAISDPADALPSRVALLASAGTVQGLLYQIGEGSARVFQIVRALKGYSYLDEAPIQDVMVTKGLDDTLLLLQSKLSGLEVVREYQDDLPEIVAHGSELNQVWTNLLDNAVDAVKDGDGGRIIVRAFTEADCLIVEVEDDGPGIPDEVLPRVFDSFFTTKEPGRGTGLGLDISYGIVTHRHGGEITVHRTGPEGTTFRVRLPLSGVTSSQ
ncbi:MAG: ATP-binding protein [Acidimicrobiia bacterium]